MTVRKIKSIGDVPYPIDNDSDAFSPLLTAGAALGITGNDAEESAWLARTSEADGVASVRSIHGNTIVQDGELVSVNMTGIESTAADESWTQTRTIPAGTLRGAGTVYDEQTETERITRVGEIDLGTLTWNIEGVWQTSKGLTRYNATLPNAKNVAAASGNDLSVSGYFTPNANVVLSGMNESYCIALFSTKVYLTLPYPEFSTEQDFTDWLSTHPVTLHYQVVPTVTTIDPPLNMTYRTEQGGTECIMVPTGENSAPPTLVAAQGYTAESLRDAALSAIAPVENGLASTNYGVGSYLVHAGQLCKVTTAIATGESITIGTNVTATTVMAEILSLVQ